MTTARKTQPPLALVRQALGGPRQVRDKSARIAATLRLWRQPAELDRRLQRLERAGWIDRRPTRVQLAVGALDMVRFVIEPGARDYYTTQGLNFNFHQILRFLDDPLALIDPSGFLSERDSIIGHVMQVVHLNPVYDLQLLMMFDDGLAQLESQLVAVLDGTHPRAQTIGAVVEDPDYHARLLAYVRRWRADPTTPDLVRTEQPLRRDPHFAAAERQFASMPGYIAWCHMLPTSVAGGVRHLLTVRQFPLPA